MKKVVKKVHQSFYEQVFLTLTIVFCCCANIFVNVVVVVVVVAETR